jgi:Ca2+-binding EF-hand superfamily protein
MQSTTRNPRRLNRIAIAAIACIATFIALPSAAQQPQAAQVEQLKAQMVQRFEQADTDGDGRLTKAETNGKMPRLHRNFEAVDGDRDGYVNQAEIVAYMETRAAGMKGARGGP